MSVEISSCIDHIGIINRELKTSRDIFLRLGFSTGGTTSMDTGISGEKAASNLHFMFDNSYLECIESREGDYLREYLRSDAAMHTVVLSSRDILLSHRLCQEAGYAVSGVMEASRPADHGKNKGTAVFGWVRILTEIIPDTLLGIAEHKTRDLIYQPERYQHANTAFAIDRIVVDCGTQESLSVCAGRWAPLNRVLAAACDEQHLVRTAELSETSEIFSQYGVRHDPGRSRYAGIVFLVKDPDIMASFAESSGLPHHVSGGLLVVDCCRELDLFLGFRRG